METSTYSAVIQPGWDIFGIANGGYTLTIAARAMAGEAAGRELVSITGYFTNPGRPGPVTVDVQPVKVGSGLSTFRAGLAADDRSVVSVLAAYADANRPVSHSESVDAPPPDLPRPEECVRALPAPDGPLPPPFMDKVEVLVHPADAAALLGDRAGIARIRGWFRLLDGEPADPLAVVLASDAFPPAVFGSNLPLKWTPTLAPHRPHPRPPTEDMAPVRVPHSIRDRWAARGGRRDLERGRRSRRPVTPTRPRSTLIPGGGATRRYGLGGRDR